MPDELLICKVAVTEWNLPKYRMGCTYSACGTLFASICSPDTMQLQARCARKKKKTMEQDTLRTDTGDTSSCMKALALFDTHEVQMQMTS